MNNSRYILALDPSGAYQEGLGTTGWCLFDIQTNKIAKFGFIYAGDYDCQFKYWDAHIKLIDSLTGYKPDIVIEDYLLYGTRADAQINSRLETPQLIGIIKYECYKRGLFIFIQTALQVKSRWTDEILVHKGYIHQEGKSFNIMGVPLSDHVRDSIRHAIHYKTYNSKFKGGYYEKETRKSYNSKRRISTR